MVVFETSAKTAEGGEEAFSKAARQIYNGILGGEYDMNGSEAIGIKYGNAPQPRRTITPMQPQDR